MGKTRDLADTSHSFIVEDLGEFRDIDASREHSPWVFGVETALWSTAARKARKWYRGGLEAAERFKWYDDEAHLSRQRRASAAGGAQENAGGNRRSGRKTDQGNGGRGGNRRSRRETAEGESGK